MVQWRNTELDFSSVGALQATLATAPTEAELARAPVAEDILVLDHAARDDNVRAMTRTAADVERLWDVCQLPDYRKIAPANHAELVVTLYGYLQREGHIATDWFAQQIAKADRMTAISILCRRASRIFGPGPSPQTARIGLRTPNTGKPKPAVSKTGSRTRCMSG